MKTSDDTESTGAPHEAHPDAFGREEALRARSATEQIYSRIVEHMLEGAVVLSNEGIVLYCNPSFSRLTGCDESRLIGHSLRDFVIPSEELTTDDLLYSKRSVHADFELAWPQSQPIPVSISASSIINGDGNPPLRCLVVSDLRTRRDVAELRETKAELERADDRKNEFLAMLGHELRNPLAPVRQASQLLDSHAQSDDPEYLKQARTVLSRQVVHLTRLVDDLLDAGRISQGTLVVEPETIDLRNVVDAAIEGAMRIIERNGHRLELEIPDHEVRCQGDMVRLTQVITNLLANAAKYTPHGGHITIKLAQKTKFATVTVRDDGRGIPAELLPHVFDPFVRGQTTIDRRTGGLGVGLTLVERLVELHEGRVEVESAGIDQGSEFRVILPIRDADAAAPNDISTVNPTPPVEDAQRKILVVDDNEDAADMLTLVLRTRGYHVECEYEGESALKLAQRFQPDVVCLDIGLPGLDGYAVARRLRKEYGDRILICALTGYGSDVDRQRAKQAQMDYHMVKPVDIEKLDATIRAWIQCDPPPMSR